MKNFLKNLTRKQIVWTAVGVVCLLIFAGLQLWSMALKNSLPAQQMAKRWSGDGGSAQISCFFSETTELTPDSIRELEAKIDSALTEASITSESENGRLWADSYSARGKITVKSQTGSIEASAIGVGGDFFLFHPFYLLDGSYFSGSDLMQDHVILDEDAAWQLFGSTNVTGMTVEISGVPHLISGVIEREDGSLNKKAGGNELTVYVSYDTLSKYGVNKGINTYEIVLPNPISGFALSVIEKNIGVEKSEVVLVENSSRFSLLPLLEVIKNFGSRSMNTKAVIYPYWENAARGMEDVLALLLLLSVLFLAVPLVLAVILVVILWKHRRWRLSDLKNLIQTMREKNWERQARKKQKAEVSGETRTLKRKKVKK